MSQPAIIIENLSKQYRLGDVGTGTLSHDLKRWWYAVRGKEDPFAKVGETNDRTQKGNSEYVWALKDINLQINQGDAVGIIGRNGAGKSTLLKLLSKTTAPTSGSIKVKGRIASLLEVGTGFHPELSGRDNIYLNGAILGMRKREIDRKLDEIVDFAGIERYLDTPVKRYSSGMYVRLAFAVAAHLDSDILIVDEVLAVGDAEFQKKCLGKMGEVSQGQGRTVLFVSHNLSSVSQLCSRGIVLSKGTMIFDGTSEESIDYYISENRVKDINSKYYRTNDIESKIYLMEAEILDYKKANKVEFDITETVWIKVVLNCKEFIPNTYGYVVIKNESEEVIIESDTYDYPPNILERIKVGINTYYLKISPNTLGVGHYYAYFSFTSRMANNFAVDVPGDILKFTIVDHTTTRGMKRRAKTSFLFQWKEFIE